MILTRWKLLAGVFGISMVGVVAMANPQCPGKTDSSREKAPPTREVQRLPGDAPKTFAVAIPASEKKAEEPLPNLVPIAAAPPALPKVEFAPTIPSAPTTPTLAPIDLPTVSPGRVVELPLPGVTAAKPAVPVPELKLELPSPAPNIVAELPRPVTAPAPTSPPPTELRLELPKVDAVPLSSPLPVAVTKSEPPIPSGVPPIPANVPIPSPPIGSNAPALAPLPGSAEPLPVTRPATAVTEAPAVKEEVETRVRVVVPLGKSPAKFDVMAGDAVLLQAVCEQVEVRSPSEKGGPVSPIKASGKVRFTAPGCEGTCDSLAVLPGSGEVELTGSVRVLCKHGKAETEIQAATMKFKLGSAPGAATIPPSFSPSVSR